MQPASRPSGPDHEPERLRALVDLGLLDPSLEPVFDALVETAALACGTPIALLGMIDARRQWFKAGVGLPGLTELPREQSFCARTVEGEGLFELPDVRLDPRFADNPLVGGDAGVRFYAGVPLALRSGERIGTLCVMDRRPRRLDPAQREALRRLAEVAVRTVENRRSEPASSEHALRIERQRLAYIIEGTGAGIWECNVQTGQARFDETSAAMVGRTRAELQPTTIAGWRGLLHPADFARSAELLEAHLDGHTPAYEVEVRLRHRDGHWVTVVTRGRVLTRSADGRPEWMFGTHVDVTRQRQQERALARSEALLQRTSEAAAVGGWELDIASGAVIMSDETKRIHGIGPGVVLDVEQALGFYPPEAQPAARAAVEAAIASGESCVFELPFVQADGNRIWVRVAGSVEYEDGEPVRLLGMIQDVTQLHRLSADLAEQHERMRVTLQSIGDAVITTDAAGCVTWLNPVAERMTGWLTAEALGHPMAQVLHMIDGETRRPVEDPASACLRQNKVIVLAQHTVLISRDGVEFGIEDSAAPIRSETGELLGVVMVFHDVTEQRRMTGEMSWRATHDALTGLVNRSEFETRLRRALEKAREDRSEHSLLFIDLDQFKLVNDAGGHSVGDELLQQVSALLRETVRARDTLARLGGDEFGAILEHCSVGQARRVAQQICDRMDSFRFVHDGRRFRIGASIGLVPVDARWSTMAAVLQAADSACYAAKEAGRNRVHAWFDTDQAIRERSGEMQWAARLEQALDEDRFELHAQRIDALDDDGDGDAGEPQALHVEVLLRMVNGDGSLVPPGAFLPAAERFNLASRIDRWVLRRALAQLAALPDLSRIETICINLSGQSVGDRAFHRFAVDALLEAGPQLRGRVCLEITETAAVTNMADAAVFVEQMRALGVRIALDDFGAGVSSFGYLKTLRVDWLKIDGQYIRNLLDDPLDAAAVRCFVDVARILGLKTVAEAVERPETLQRLRELGIDRAQGFLLHRPQPIAALLDPAAVVPDGHPVAGTASLE